MRGRSEAIMMTLFGISKTYGKAYCFPGQKRILSLMDEYHGFEISRRTLCRDLLGLEKEGFIKRTRRLRRTPAGKLLFNSTLYKFTGKAFKYLFGLGKWVKGLLSAFRVPKLAHNKSQTENEISLIGGALRGNPVEFQVGKLPARIKSPASPVES